MLRWIATVAILALLVLDLALPSTPVGRRGSEAAARSEVPSSRVAVGERFPLTRLLDLDGGSFDVASLRGHRVLLTFERSVDW